MRVGRDSDAQFKLKDCFSASLFLSRAMFLQCTGGVLRKAKGSRLFSSFVPRGLSAIASPNMTGSVKDRAGDYTTLEVSLDEGTGVAHVLMNRPEKMNAMNMPLWEELADCFSEINRDSTVRCVVLGSTSGNFSSGMDMSVFGELMKLHKQEACEARAREKLDRVIEFFQDSVSGPEKCRVPVLCAIDGMAIGGAVDLLTSCCMRYCTEQSKFSVKEVDLAIVADVGTLQRLPSIVGDQRSRELAYTGRLFDGKEALEMGLVLEAFPSSEEMMDSVNKLAVTIAQKSPLTVRNVKRTLLYNREHDTEDSLEQVRTMNCSVLHSQDLEIAMGAAMGKTIPVFERGD